jgi:glycerol-3-phosphate dehydrogenase
MTRDLDTLVARTLDVLVVGGGITGLAVAYDAAQRGLAVGLIDRDDFGNAATLRHLPLVSGDVRLASSAARQHARERRTLARIAPHALQPAACVVPIYRSLRHGTLATRAAFSAATLFGSVGSGDLPAVLRLPRARVVSRRRAIQHFPGLRRKGLTGAAVFHEYLAPEPDRLVFTFALAAAERGAVLANHVEALAPLVEGRRVAGVRARDAITGRTIEIGARLTINATGSAIDALLAPLDAVVRLPMRSRMTLVTRRDAGEEVLGGFAEGRQPLFLVPWRQRALFGPWYGDAGLTACIGQLNQAFPALDLALKDVALVHRALVPADGGDHLVDHGTAGVDGVITAIAASTTTARALAERVTNLAIQKLARAAAPCRTAETILPGASLRDVGAAIGDARREYDAGLPTDTIPHLLVAYGSRYRDVMQLAADRPDWRTRVAADSPVIGAELVHAARREMVTTLADAVVRRTPLGALGEPGDETLTRAAEIVGGELRWTADRVRDEVAAVRKVYGTLKPLNT